MVKKNELDQEDSLHDDEINKKNNIQNDQNQQNEKVLISLQVDKNTLLVWDTFCKQKGITRSNLIRTAVNSHILSGQNPELESVIADLLFKERNEIILKLSYLLTDQFNQIKQFLMDKLP